MKYRIIGFIPLYFKDKNNNNSYVKYYKAVCTRCIDTADLDGGAVAFGGAKCINVSLEMFKISADTVQKYSNLDKNVAYSLLFDSFGRIAEITKTE